LKSEQYSEADIFSKITTWCELLEPILKSATDNDTIEKIFDATLSIIYKCDHDFKESFKSTLYKMKLDYLKISKEANETEEDNYFLEITKKIEKILKFL